MEEKFIQQVELSGQLWDLFYYVTDYFGFHISFFATNVNEAMIKNDQAAQNRRFIAAIVFGDKLIDLATTQTGIGFDSRKSKTQKKTWNQAKTQHSAVFVLYS